ncbi:hypothetical protein COCNU_03G009160 [Cocos nucifera]|uniref:Uncharacterized protein n=1 Tax=Cocos nucifera TaxID=13894 RepID=A0A8K0MYG0_COCNU|nr:hypothetical protein COCNU_03G009160 [Cocos nucifera]
MDQPQVATCDCLKFKLDAKEHRMGIQRLENNFKDFASAGKKLRQQRNKA